MNKAIDSFMAACDAQIGLPFLQPSEVNEYSGSGLIGCKYPEGRSSAGFVSVSLLAAGDVIDRRKTWNAHRYWTECERVLCPQSGDFALFGKDGHATRIMVVCSQAGNELLMGVVNDDDGILTPSMAEANDARVAVVRSEDCRADLLGYVANPLRIGPRRNVSFLQRSPIPLPTDTETIALMTVAFMLQPVVLYLLIQKSFLAPLLPVPILLAFAAGASKPRRFSLFAWTKKMLARKGK